MTESEKLYNYRWVLEKYGHQLMWVLRDDNNIAICSLDPVIVRTQWDLYGTDLRALIEDCIVAVENVERPALLDENRSVVLGFDRKKKLSRGVKKAEAEVRFVTNFELRK